MSGEARNAPWTTMDVALSRWTSLPLAAAVLICGLIATGFANLHLLNPDGVAYMRIAQYWCTGQTGLMISGYWGPMLSWLMVPWLWLGAEPLVAARITMGLSGLLFWSGTVAVARAAGLTEGLVRLAAWSSIPATVCGSVETIAPDLLVGGWVALAVAQQISPRWLEGARRPLACGATWGLAYLAKAVAFPLALLFLGLATAFHRISNRSAHHPKVESSNSANPIRILRASALTLAAFLVGSAPWITILSLKYHGPTFSTSGRIAHAVVGPPDQERSHPFGRTFHIPEAGRITVWEDPSEMAYAFWSPLERGDYFKHQASLVLRNAQTVAGILTGVGLFAAAWLGILASLWPAGTWSQTLQSQRWRWGVGLVGLLAGLYLPVYIKPVDARYLHPAWPFLLTASIGAAAWIGTLWHQRQGAATNGYRRTLRLLVAGVALAFTAPSFPRLVDAMTGIPDPGSLLAQDMAGRLRRANVLGPVAGNALVAGGRVGLLTAFLLGQPWRGESSGTATDGFLSSGATLVIVRRDQPVAAECRGDPRFKNLDPILFATQEDPSTYPIQAFQVPAPPRGP